VLPFLIVAISRLLQSVPVGTAAPAVQPSTAKLIDSYASLRTWKFLELRVEMNAAPARNLQLPFPVFEPHLFHRNCSFALRNLNIGNCVAHKTAVDIDISTRRIRTQLQLRRKGSHILGGRRLP
jgi:hypothetical protein